MAGNYSMTRTYVDGDILTAADFVAEHENHITNQTPQGTDDYSADLTQMRSTANPGDVSSESLPTTLAGELERLRYEVQAIKTKLNGSTVAQWYAKSYSVVVSDGSVTTAKLANNATFSQFVRATSDTITVTGGGGETTLVSQAITVTRNRTRVAATVTFTTVTSSASETYTLRLKRGATVLDTKSIVVNTGVVTTSCTFFYAEAAGAGTYTYSLTAQAPINTNSTQNESEIYVEEVV